MDKDFFNGFVAFGGFNLFLLHRILAILKNTTHGTTAQTLK
jgi:hypothetical protein